MHRFGTIRLFENGNLREKKEKVFFDYHESNESRPYRFVYLFRNEQDPAENPHQIISLGANTTIEISYYDKNNVK